MACPAGTTLNVTDKRCLSICLGDTVYNTNTSKCECPSDRPI